MFDKTFFKFLFGFTLILGASFTILAIANTLKAGENAASVYRSLTK